MVWTKDFIFFARERETIAVDTIPLNEIVSVTDMAKKVQRRKSLSFITLNAGTEYNITELGRGQKDMETSMLNKIQSNSDSQTLFQIRTVPEGFNSGRFGFDSKYSYALHDMYQGITYLTNVVSEHISCKQIRKSSASILSQNSSEMPKTQSGEQRFKVALIQSGKMFERYTARRKFKEQLLFSSFW